MSNSIAFPQEAFAAELSKYPQSHRDRLVSGRAAQPGAWYWIASRQHLDRSFSSKQHLLLVSVRRRLPGGGLFQQAHHAPNKKALIESALGEIEQYKCAAVG
nr:hypothetical protein [Propionivibrio sp.]